MSGVPVEPKVSGVSFVEPGYASAQSNEGNRRAALRGCKSCHKYRTIFAALPSYQPPPSSPSLPSGRNPSAKPGFPRRKQLRNYPDGPHKGSYLIYSASTTLQAPQGCFGGLPAWRHEAVRQSNPIFHFSLSPSARKLHE